MQINQKENSILDNNNNNNENLGVSVKNKSTPEFTIGFNAPSIDINSNVKKESKKFNEKDFLKLYEGREVIIDEDSICEEESPNKNNSLKKINQIKESPKDKNKKDEKENDSEFKVNYKN